MPHLPHRPVALFLPLVAVLLAVAACTGEVGPTHADPSAARSGSGDPSHTSEEDGAAPPGSSVADPTAQDTDHEDTDHEDTDPGDTDPGALEPSAEPTGMVSADAAALYMKHCAACHGDRGQGSPFGLPLTRDMGLSALIAKIDQQMPQGNPAACTGECAQRIGQYVQAQFVEGQAQATTCVDAPVGARQLRLLTRREYRNTVLDLLGIEVPNLSSLPVEPRVAGFDNNAQASVVTSRHADGYASLAASVASLALQADPKRFGCSESACLEDAVRGFGKRAFRRPLSDAEVERYGALFSPDLTGGSYAVGAELLITAMLNSPHFLYRSEMGQLNADGIHDLTAYETASALSYLFWGTMPDDLLMAAADEDALSTPAQLRTQAQRLLADPRAVDQLATFATQWLRTDGVLGANKDADIYPTYSEAVRLAQVAEQARLFEDLFLGSQSTFEALYRAQHTFVNGPLAAFYGLPDPGTGDALARTMVTPESGRGGILALGAVLAAHAHQNESSPIKRGLFVRDRLLCQALPDPPANLDTTPPGLDPTLTTRERFGRHTADDACRGCHRFIDGVGFGFEGFDGVGARRVLENGLPIDESGSVIGLEGLTVPSTDDYVGIQALSGLLADSESAQRCLATQYFRFASGRAGLAPDQCSIEHLGNAFQAGGLRLSELLVAVTQLDAFIHRQDQAP